MITVARVLARGAEYITGEIDLKTFWHWLACETWMMDIDENISGAVKDLVQSMKLDIYEYQKGNITEEELKERLKG